jgi:hypothetical protein
MPVIDGQLELGRDLRDQAVEQVEANADETWLQQAKAALWARILQGGEFTTDDLDAPRPREPRAWGPVMLAAARAGLIVNTHTTRQSSQPRCHARPKAVWRVDADAVRRSVAR